MFLLKLKLGRVLDGNNPFITGDKTRKHIEKSGFTRTSAARNNDIQTGFYTGFEKLHGFWSDRTKTNQLFNGDRFLENLRMVSTDQQVRLAG
jgi:hypothetical protein